MKLKNLVLAILIFICNACKKNEVIDPTLNASYVNKIMPLGASRVEGGKPEYESYRFELWKDLKENNWKFDFIGSQSDDAPYPSFNGTKFDTDHEGRGGWTSAEIMNGLNDWLDQTRSADIVLLSSPGGNDALQGLPYSQAVININSIIDKLQADNPSITIIIEQMAPGHTDIMTDKLRYFFEKMQQEVLNMAAKHTTPSSKVIAIDMFTGFNNSLLADNVHYNAAGAAFIANRYYNALVKIMR